MFVNRHMELAHLEECYRSERAELLVLYGRRRVGKTELLRRFCEGKRHAFFIATLSSDRDQLASFSQEVWRYTHPEVADRFTFPSWEAAFRALADLPDRPVVVVDELTYLINGNRAIPSILQRVWDGLLRDGRLFLVLCGSYVGMMERDVLGHTAPLYGRRTGGLLLEPLDLRAAAAFFPAFAPIQQVEAWAVLGGMPYYLSTFSDHDDIFANIRRHVLEPQGTLRREAQLLLMEELREPRNYFSILRAIAEGNARLNEIAQAAQVGDAPTTGRYLDILQGMRVVRRIVPATEPRPEKSRRGLYQIADGFLRFWFRYVHPHQGSLDLGLADAVLAQRIRPNFDQYVSDAFEEAGRSHIARLARSGHLEFLPERVGRWWSRDGEVDVVAVSNADGAMLVGECKWSVKPVGTDVLADLQHKAAVIDPSRRWPKVSYALFAKAGFTPELERVAAAQAVRLVTPTEMVTDDR